MSNISELKTNTQLLEVIEKSSHIKLGPGEILEQRVSFVYGSMSSDSDVTREQIKQVILDQAIYKEIIQAKNHTTHTPFEPDNQYCKYCGVPLFVKEQTKKNCKTEARKRKLAILVCNATFWLGDKISRAPEFMFFSWYPVYNKLMMISYELSIKYDLDKWTKKTK